MIFSCLELIDDVTSYVLVLLGGRIVSPEPAVNVFEARAMANCINFLPGVP